MDLAEITWSDERPPERAPVVRRSGGSWRARWPWIAAMIAALGGAGAGVYLLLRDEPVFTLQRLALAGETRLSPDEVLALAGLNRGMSLLAVDEGAAARALGALPFVRSVRVARELPSTLRIDLVERRPAMLVALGPLYVADEEGMIYRRMRPGEQRSLPVLTGIDRTQVGARPAAAAARVREAMELARALAGRCFEEIAHDEVRGFGVLLCGGTEVRLGRPPFAPKIARLARALEKAPRARIVFVDDDRRPKRVVVRFAREGG